MLGGRRYSDKDLTGWRAITCWFAQRASETWEWVDKRDIDKYAVSIFIMTGTWKLTEWAVGYANTHEASVQGAAMIAAVTAPYMALQAAAIAFYFKARQ